MKRVVLSAIAALVVFAAAMQAQEGMSTTRIQAQHKPPSFMEEKLPRYEENLLKTLDSNIPAMQAQAVQTMRDLEQMFPKYPFTLLLKPLENKLKDENADGIVRTLAALALDELHSGAGDAVIASVANSSQDKGLQLLCNALLVKSQYK